MTNEKLAERAVKAKGWRWMAGMRMAVIDKICVLVAQNGDPIYQNVYGFRSPVPRALPDLSDPATLGCLRQFAAKVHEGFDVTVYEVKGYDTPTGKWAVLDRGGRTVKWGIFDLPQSEDFTAWGLVEALEAAP